MFVERSIIAEFSLQSGVFDGGGNSYRAEGCRATAKINLYGGPSMGQLEFAIYGLPLQVMNQLTTLGTQLNLYGKNSIKVYAGPKGAETLIFEGDILTAYMEGLAMPNVPFRVSAIAGHLNSVKKADATTREGDVDVAELMKSLAGQMGYSFENNGVDQKISSPHYYGSARNQAMELAQHAGIQMIIDRGTLSIWKTGEARSGATSWPVSRSTGLVTYPAFNQAGVVVTMLFNPSIRFGDKINVQSDVTPANGEWIIYNVAVDIAAQVPKGPWFETLMTFRGGETPP